jgi:2-aminophenol/2-amino-5-chlorophenol 1,6-dioxygenase alpha subunit
MPIVSAFILPSSPLPMVHEANPAWGAFAEAMREAGKLLEASQPDTILLYSTAWIAVLDQLWQTRERSTGLHVDENWHEYGDLPFDIRTDIELATACVDAVTAAGIRSRPVDYDAFPIDTGTIVASNFLDPSHCLPFVLTSNNLYHSPAETALIAQTAVAQADNLRRRIAVVGCGGLSGAFFRHEINIEDDHIQNPQADEWNKKLLGTLGKGAQETLNLLPDYAALAKADMGMKHLHFVLGAMNNRYQSASVLHYGPLYGAGGAVIHFAP